jgi:hypothetical protein
MAPKNKGKGKDAGDAKDAGTKGKLKPATSINVRHILCEKHGKKEEALEKIRNGAKFDEVAREMSEDKARQGECASFLYDIDAATALKLLEGTGCVEYLRPVVGAVFRKRREAHGSPSPQMHIGSEC